MEGSSIARDTEHGRAVTAQLSRRQRHARGGDRRGDLRAQRRRAVQGHPPPGARGLRGLLLQPALPDAELRAGRTGGRSRTGSSCCPTRCTARSRTSSSSSSTATTRSSTRRRSDRLAVEDLHRRIEDDCPEALVLPPREVYRVEAITKSDEPDVPGWAYFLDLWTETGPARLHIEGELEETGERYTTTLDRHPALTRVPRPVELRLNAESPPVGGLSAIRRSGGLRGKGTFSEGLALWLPSLSDPVRVACSLRCRGTRRGGASSSGTSPGRTGRRRGWGRRARAARPAPRGARRAAARPGTGPCASSSASRSRPSWVAIDHAAPRSASRKPRRKKATSVGSP